MKTTLLLTSAAALAALSIVGAFRAHGWRTEREARLEEARRARLAAEQTLTQAEQNLVAPPASAPTTSPATPPSAKAPATPSAADRRRARHELLASNPELLQLYRKQLRANLHQQYSPLTRRLGLTAQQEARFVDALIQRDELQEDLWRTAKARGLSERDPALNEVRKQYMAEHEATLKEILGTAGYAAKRDFDRAEPARQFAEDAASLVAYTSHALTPVQMEQLKDVCAEFSAAYRSGGKADVGTVDWDAALVRAGTFLSEQQLAAVKAHSQGYRVMKLVGQFYADRQKAAK